MKLIIRDKCYIKGLDKSLKNIIKKDLSLPNPKYQDATKFGRCTRGIKKDIKVFRETPEGLAVPRGYIPELAEYIDGVDEIIDETSFPPPEIPIKSNIVLRPHQVDWVEDLLSGRYGIGIAPPGSGKTVAGLEVAARLNTKTLWLTHTSVLARQAIARINQFLEVSSVGFFGGGKETLGDITVGLVQTLCRRDLSGYRDRWGLVIPDESHLVPGEQTFMKVVNELAPRYVYGLTATPYRKDRLERLMFLSIGPVLAEIAREDIPNRVKTYVKFRETEFYSDKYNPNYSGSYAWLTKDLIKDKKRNTLIANDIITEAKKGNICVVLSFIVKHLELIKRQVEDKVRCALVDKDTKEDIREEVFTSMAHGETKVLFATFKLLLHGFDLPIMSRLFLVHPTRNRVIIEQSCGRIERNIAGKKYALVYDYVDSLVDILKYQHEQRLAIYEMNNISEV